MKVVLTGVQKYHNDIREKLSDLGLEILDHKDEKQAFTAEEYEADIVVGINVFRGSDIESFKNLKFIQSVAAGFDGVPLDSLKQHNVVFCNARDVYSIPIAELVIMSVLELYKKVPKFTKDKSERVWDSEHRLLELTNKKIAILGTGSIGVETAKRFKAFGTTTYGFNRSLKSAEYFDEIISIDELESVASEMDVIVVAVPLTKETTHIINKNILSKMHKKSVLVNVGRGPSVDTEELYETLANGRILGAALDVFEVEPLPKDSKLWELDNLLITPHIASGSDYMNKRVYDLVYNNIKTFLDGGEVINRIV